MLKHNKKKNTCIVYEQLLTVATRLASQKKNEEFEYVIGLAKKYYSPKTNIGKEKKILQSICESSCKPEDSENLIEEAIKELKFIDSKKLEAEKILLINEINSNIGSDLFKIPIKNYKIYASAQILINESKDNKFTTSADERVKIKKLLKENLSNKKIKIEELEVDNLTYKILINKFNQKYGPYISEDQKNILSHWVKYLITEKDEDIKNVISESVKKIEATIKKSLKDKTHKATDYYELLKEADETLKNKSFDEVNEEVIYDVMRYFDLVKDLENKE